MKMKGFIEKMANRRDDIPPGRDPFQDRGGRGVFGRFLDKLLPARADEDDEDDDSGKGDSSGEGESAMGSVVDGAVSKGDSDGRMTRKKQNRILRKASVTVRSMADKGDALTKATGGNFNTIESDLRRMSGADLNAYMSTNPNQMAKTGETWVRQEMIARFLQLLLPIALLEQDEQARLLFGVEQVEVALGVLKVCFGEDHAGSLYPPAWLVGNDHFLAPALEAAALPP